MTHKSGSSFIQGQWVLGKGEAFSSEDPATGKTIWAGNAADSSDVDRAVDAARAAFPDWAARTFEDRLESLELYRSILEARKEEIAQTIAQENGKPLWDSLGEASAMIGKIAISAQAFHDRTPTRASDTPAGRAVLRHRPHGVLAVFGPYNFPGHLPNGHIVPALLAGNCVLFKPSELTPKMGELLTQCLAEAKLPSGVISLLQGPRKTGEALAAHSDIDGLLFTGSVRVGQVLHEQFAGKTGKVLALELGGNNPLIVHDVQDLKAAALTTIQSAFITSGQRCTCARRLIVPTGPEGDQFIEILADMTTKIVTGAWDDTPAPFMGPLISQSAATNLLRAQDGWIGRGAEAIVEAKQLLPDRPFISPGLIDVTEQQDRADTELFGPLLQIIRTPSIETAMDEANNTRFGLAAGLLSDDGLLWEHFLAHARAGIVNWNKPLTGASSAAPFGGIGLSGNHRPSAYYAADYCAYPMASMEAPKLEMPKTLPQGINL
jgi:succinylglutamic semialdehyde dehydrogenase